MTAEPAEAELRRFLTDRVRSVHARDVSALHDAHAADVLSFPVVGPARTHGRDAIDQALRTWLDAYAEGPTYAVHDLRVEADGDWGHCAFRYHVSGTLKEGGTVDMWVRSTLVCRREDGRWRVVHAHESVPVDAATGTARLSVGPDDD